MGINTWFEKYKGNSNYKENGILWLSLNSVDILDLKKQKSSWLAVTESCEWNPESLLGSMTFKARAEKADSQQQNWDVKTNMLERL